MALRRNERAACACIALGVGAVLIGSIFSGFAAPNAGTPSPSPGPDSAFTMAKEPDTTPEPTLEPTPEPTPLVQTVHFSATGDNLIHPGLYNQARNRATDGGYDFTYAYENLRDFYAGFDVNWLNQETLVNDLYEPSGYPMFSTPTDITKALYDIGFRVFSLSNNHSYDKRADGIEASLAHWATMPDDVASMGFYTIDRYDDYVYHTVNGITFGYLSYTEYTNGLPVPSGAQHRVILLSEKELIEKQIQEVRPNCDVLVVSCHWGVEGSHNVNDFQRQTAQWLADQGVDLIIGTHPHVSQTAQWLSAADGTDAFVTYSLGNFVNAQSSADNMIGEILDITFEKTTQPDGAWSVEIKDPKLHGVVTHYESHYNNIRAYLFRDYTDELGKAHGNFSLSRDYIRSVLEKSIDAEFLTLD